MTLKNIYLDQFIKVVERAAYGASKFRGKNDKISADKDKQHKNHNNKSKFLANETSENISTLLRTLKKEIQKNSTYVGNEFVSQVRSMKEG